VQFTADQEFHDKLRVAQALLRHQIPNGDIASILDRALSLLVADVKQKKLAERKRPGRRERSKSSSRGKPRPPSRHIPAEVKRRVVARDGIQCAFVAADGRRCQEVGFLEFRHQKPHGKGGAPTLENTSLYCRAHNAYAATCDYGEAKMAERIGAARHRRGPPRRESTDEVGFPGEA
jgi:hypothetical protein